MKISVATPSYRQLQWLKLCVASVNDQKGIEVEHIIQDAQSGSELEEWVRNHSQARLFVESDSGMYDAINRGFLKATGDVVAWLNSDEQYLPGALARVARFFTEHPEVDVLFGDAVLLDEEGALLSYRRAILPSLLHIQLSHLNTLSCATFVRRSVIERSLLLKPDWKAIADGVWVADMIKAKLRMAVLPEPLAAFTITKENLGQSSLAFKESERWKYQNTTALQRSLKRWVVLMHRLRKMWNGAYRIRHFDTEVYTQASPEKRTPVSSHALSFTWAQSQNDGRLRGMLRNAMVSMAQWLRKENRRQPTAFSLPFSSRRDRHWSWGFCFLLAILLTGVVLLLEQITSGPVIVAPMFSMFLMLILSFRLEPLQLLPFAASFTGAIYCSLHYMQPFTGSSTDWMRIGVRLIGFITAAALAVLFSKSRREAKARQDQTIEIITTMPVPVIISDALGAILFANDEAVELTKIPQEKLLGARYPELFMTSHDEGSAMRDYIRFFLSAPEITSSSNKQSICLKQGAEGLHVTEARFICLGHGESRYMVTVFKT